ncbi:uncharacterized protein isoform X2 [Rhodnius prolixus]|uniref:uncharacterized protein isoform X2 n=1 Tax=Rhodnius prolixus TaxID=13249 RepID=UPI003D1890B4
METKTFLIQVLFFLIFKGAAECLRDVHISVPVAVRLAQPATLTCEYDLQNETLYSVKWYKDGREFFVYKPQDKSSVKKVSPTIGVDHHSIDVHQSNASQVHFPKTSVLMSGQYGCEVSTDSPFIRTFYVSGHMEVVEPPNGRPELSGLKARYSLGDIVHANCASAGSRPAVNLTWVMNGKSAPKKHVKIFREVTDTDLVISTSAIKFQARVAHFPQGRLKLQCTASLHNLYWQTVEKNATLQRHTVTEGQFDLAPVADVTLNEKTTDVDFLPSREGMQTSAIPTRFLTDLGPETMQVPTSGQPNLKIEVFMQPLLMNIVGSYYFIATIQIL